MDRPKKKTIASMKKYYKDRPESTCVQRRFFTRNSEYDEFQQLLFVNNNFAEFLYLLDVITSISDQVKSNQSFM